MTVVSDFTALLGGASWTAVSGQTPQTNGTPVILTYSFPTEPQPSYFAQFGSVASTFLPFNESDRAAARDALSAWASISGLTFIEVSGNRGDIRFSWLDTNQLPDPALHAWGLGYSGYAPFYMQTGSIYPATEEYWLTQNVFYDFGGDTFFDPHNIPSVSAFHYALLHEIGHTLGLKHPFTVGSLNDRTLATNLDRHSNTIMSYTADIPGAPGTVLGPLDIAAAQYLYGLPSQDGTQFISWSFDAATETLHENGTSGTDFIRGTGTHDVIDAGAGNDYIYTSSGNDYVVGGPGLDTASGGTGIDTYAVGVTRSNGRITQDAFSGMTLRVPEGIEFIRDFERILYTDALVAYDIQGNAGNAYRLYQAAFDRTPDTAGLSFWVHQLDLGVSIQNVAQGFVNAAEFRSVYGANPTNVHIVDLMYSNVLGRAGEPAGINFWVGQLNGGLSVAALLNGFAVSSGNHGIVDPVIAQGIVLDHTLFLV